MALPSSMDLRGALVVAYIASVCLVCLDILLTKYYNLSRDKYEERICAEQRSLDVVDAPLRLLCYACMIVTR
jgi:hypothetical protein